MKTLLCILFALFFSAFLGAGKVTVIGSPGKVFSQKKEKFGFDDFLNINQDHFDSVVKGLDSKPKRVLFVKSNEKVGDKFQQYNRVRRLHLAVAMKKFNKISRLLRLGALPHMPNRFGRNAINIAIIQDQPALAKLLANWSITIAKSQKSFEEIFPKEAHLLQIWPELSREEKRLHKAYLALELRPLRTVYTAMKRGFKEQMIKDYQSHLQIRQRKSFIKSPIQKIRELGLQKLFGESQK